MAVRAFHLGPGRYGLLTSAMAIGSVTGALLAARRPRPTVFHLVTGASLFGTGLALGALTPTHTLFAATLALVGVAAQTFTTSANAAVQLGTEPVLRGRVMALFLATALGTTPLGAPVVGWVADRFGPRWGLAVGAAGGLAAALIGAVFVARRGALVAYVPPSRSDDVEETSV
jgi:MFS family permease